MGLSPLPPPGLPPLPIGPPQMAAIREGLNEVVPPVFLAVLPWWQLERRVCSDVVDVEALRASTKYQTLSASSKTARV